MREQDPKDRVRSVLRSGEQLIWSGAPDVEAAASRRRGGGTISFMAMVVLIVAMAFFQGRDETLSLFEAIPAFLIANPQVPIGMALVAGIVVLIHVFGFDTRSRLRRHFSGHAYGITDQRVIVIEGETVTSFAGDELQRIEVVERAQGYEDVIFGSRRLSSGGSSGNRDPIRIERARIGFKAITNAVEMKELLEKWIQNELQETAEAVADFVEAQTDDPTSEGSPKAGTVTLRHDATGLTIDYPDEWTLQVRRKKKPFGKTFFDREKWGSPSEIRDWNYLRLDGPGGCGVDAEVFESPLIADYETLANSRLASLAGELLDSDPAVEQHGMRGFTVARRNMMQARAAAGSSGSAAVVTPFRQTVLHDGRHQVTITSRWPEKSPELARAVALVAGSVRLSA